MTPFPPVSVDDASAPRTARRARVLIGLIAVVGAAALPGHLENLRRDAPLLRLWFDPDAQQRLALGPAYDFLRTADALLPKDAVVLLLTSGTDVSRREYAAFHRALYFLAPRPVWWVAPAPSDSTWESRWWISAPLTAESIAAIAREKRASHVLAFELSEPVPVGEKIADLPGGALFSLAPGQRPELTRAAAPPMRVAPLWPIRFAAAVLVIALLGSSAVACAGSFGLAVTGIEAAALAWTLGAGLASIAMLWLHALSVALAHQIAVVTALAVGSFTVAWRIGRRRPPRPVGERAATRSGPFAALSAALLAASILIVAASALGKPLTAWDSWAVWGMRARAIFIEGRISPAIYADPSRAATLLRYPLLFPLLESWVYAWLGAPDDRLAGAVCVLCHAALPALVYAALLRRGADRASALCGSAALAAAPSLIRLAGSAFADVPVALFATVAAIYLVEWLEARRGGALIVATLAAGCLPWTKHEGWILVAALALATLIAGRASRRARSAAAALLAGAAVVAGPWSVFAAAYAPPMPQFDAATPARLVAGLTRLPSIVWRAAAALLSPDAGWVWPLALLFVVLGRRGAAPARPSALLPLTAALYLAALTLAYVFSAYVPYQQHVAASFFRLSAHVVALPLLWIAYHATAQP